MPLKHRHKFMHNSAECCILLVIVVVAQQYRRRCVFACAAFIGQLSFCLWLIVKGVTFASGRKSKS